MKTQRVLLSLVALAAVACGSHPSADETPAPKALELPETCEQYMGAYRRCLLTLDSAGGDAVDRRLASMREGFLASFKDESSRPQLADSCGMSLQRLNASCR